MHITPERIDRRALISSHEKIHRKEVCFRFDVEISCSVILMDRNGPFNGSLDKWGGERERKRAGEEEEKQGKEKENKKNK